MTPGSPQRAPAAAPATAITTATHPSTLSTESSRASARADTVDCAKPFMILTTPVTSAASTSAAERWYLPSSNQRSISGVAIQMTAEPSATIGRISRASFAISRRRSTTPGAARSRGSRE